MFGSVKANVEFAKTQALECVPAKKAFSNAIFTHFSKQMMSPIHSIFRESNGKVR